MRLPLLLAAATLAQPATALASPTAPPAPAPGSTTTVTGVVTRADGRWTADDRAIVTDAVIVTDDGRRVTVTQLGGHAPATAGRPAMTQHTWHAAPRLYPGDRVTVTARAGVTRGGAPRLAAEDVVVLAGGAARFVRTGPTGAGSYLYWPSGCAFVTSTNDTGDLAGDLERQIVAASLAEWNDAVAGCSYMDLVAGEPAPDAEIGHDGLNIIRFRDRWCRPATDEDPELCLSAAAAGLTTMIFVDDEDSARDGEIVDADIELNAQHFAISADGASQGDAPCLADLANTLVHELGHLLGLDHTCLDADDPPKLDGDGAAVPRCTETTDPAITEATMYPYQDCGETDKATVSDDEVDAICTIYPLADDPGVCEPAGAGDDGGCCSAAGDGAGGAGASGAAALAAACGLLIVASGRRRRAPANRRR